MPTVCGRLNSRQKRCSAASSILFPEQLLRLLQCFPRVKRRPQEHVSLTSENTMLREHILSTLLHRRSRVEQWPQLHIEVTDARDANAPPGEQRHLCMQILFTQEFVPNSFERGSCALIGLDNNIARRVQANIATTCRPSSSCLQVSSRCMLTFISSSKYLNKGSQQVWNTYVISIMWAQSQSCL